MTFKKQWLSDALSLLALGFFAGMAALLLPDANNWSDYILPALLAIGALRLLYEMTINRNHVPTLASGYLTQRAIAQLLQQNGCRQIVDLGSGRGGLTRRIARAIPQAHVIGVEWARLAHWQAIVAQRLFGPTNIDYIKADMMTYDCSTADAVVLFLDPARMQAVGDKLLSELKPGSLVISNRFQLQGAWQADTQLSTTLLGAPLWVYHKV